MKTIVIYKSVSGFTKKYAEWIAGELKADIYKSGKVNIKKLMQYDIIIFGGSLHAVGISGVNLIKKNFDKLKNKHVIVFATGASPLKENILTEVKNKNFTKDEQKKIRFFYFRGGFDFNKLDYFNKAIMTMLKWQLSKKKERNADEQGMMDAFENPVDFTKKSNIVELVKYVKSLNKKRK